HGALRARTRAFFCALTLALLTSAAVSAQDWGNEATGGAGVNIDAAFASVTINVTTVGATKRVQMTASESGNKVWLALVVDGSLSVSSIDDIPVGTYTITNTGAAGTALASQGLSGSNIIGTGGLSSAKYLHATGGTAYVFDDNTDDHHHLIHLRATEFHQSVMNSADGRVKCQFTPDGDLMTNTYPTTLSTCGSGTAAGDGWFEGAMVFGYDNTVTATPTAPATFVEWRDGDGNVISTDNPYTFIAWGPKEVVAVFSDGVGCPSATPATPTYEVTATVSPAGAGTVTGTGTFDEGNDVTLTANPANRRYRFVRWMENKSEVGTDVTYNINDIAAAHTLVAEFEEIPVTLDDNGTSDYYTATLATFSTETDFQLMRTFYAGMWNTVCFPFDLTADQIAASDMSTATFYTLSSVTGDAAKGLDFNVIEVTSLSARTPYLVQVSGANIVNPVFEGVTLAASAFTNNTSGTNVGDTTFFGTVHPTDLEIGENSGFLFLGQNNALYWPNVANKIRAFRAYFYSGSSVVQSVHPRARIVVKEQTATDLSDKADESFNSDNAARKYMQDGVLVIEKNGKKYNAVGQEME
ncbi:MAG: hypothetical protein II970_08585, partial [Paludibacteraceae bacterium]|nr:hypothetical protein [Paludibacteraceae bacterium]